MIDYEEDWIWQYIFKYEGSICLRSTMFAGPAALLSLALVFLREQDLPVDEYLDTDRPYKSQVWTATTAVLILMLGFRTRTAFSRFWEGTGLLHQMRGEWFDSVSCCVTFSRAAAVSGKRQEVREFRHTIVRLMSLCHGSALEEIAGNDCDKLEVIDAFGLDDGTLRHLKNCKETYAFNRVEVLLHLTQSLITKSHDDGVLKIAPPILSRVYQTLSRGFVNLLNAKKITDTRFPFPYAQLIGILLVVHLILTPLQLAVHFESKIWAPIFTFIPVFGMFSLNFVAAELENPFGDDSNDLPLSHFQHEMNNCLLMLLQEDADLISGLSERCIYSFEKLQEIVQGGDDDKPISARISMFSDTMGDEMQKADSQGEGKRSRGSTESAFSTLSKRKASSKSSGTPRGRNTASNVFNAISSERPPSADGSQPTDTPIQAKAPAPLQIECGSERSQEFEREVSPISKGEAQAMGQQTESGPVSYGSEANAWHHQNAGQMQFVQQDPRVLALNGNLEEFNKALRNWAQVIDQPKASVQALSKSMTDFNQALQSWTHMIEDQVSELSRNSVAMKHLGDSIPALVGTLQPVMHVDNGIYGETTYTSFKAFPYV